MGFRLLWLFINGSIVMSPVFCGLMVEVSDC